MGEFSNTPVRGVQFDLVDLPPEGLDLEGEVPAEELGLEDEDRRRFVSPVAYRLHLEPINGGNDMLVRGSLSCEYEGVCDRCEEVFRRKIETSEVCHELEKPFGTTVDLTEDLREDILMLFPQRLLCREDCRGLCPRCGADLNEGPCQCEDEAPPEGEEDDPWAALGGFGSEEER